MISKMSTAILCQQQDVIQTFVFLREEKKLLLQQQQQAEVQPMSNQDTRNGENSAAFAEMPQHQPQFREQMNDLNRRLHAVVQRMSAKQRYKKRKTKQIRLASGTPEIEHAQSSARLFKDDIMNRLKAVHTSQLAIIDDLRGDSKMYSELADMLEAGTIADDEGEAQQQGETRELNESEQFRQSMRDQVLGVMRSSEERQKETERSRQETEERDRLHQACLEEIRTQSAEQTRLRLAQLEELSEQSKRKAAEDIARYRRQMTKRRADDAWRMRWLDQLDLVFERRANNSANAG